MGAASTGWARPCHVGLNLEKNLAAERVRLVPLESIRSLAARHAASKEDDDAAACLRDGELVGPADLLRSTLRS